MEEMINLYELISNGLQAIEAPTYSRSLIIGALAYVYYILGKSELDNNRAREKSGARRKGLEDRSLF